VLRLLATLALAANRRPFDRRQV
jgi:hypothetical protein